ncbi:MAG: membrane-bound lytic murein transglycosylase MltF, partial [Gammaproteobacteria bacterium]|nr:membrane-bound lytic murein transglycosylase MltF [Gammaproteobacteria bacterium]
MSRKFLVIGAITLVVLAGLSFGLRTEETQLQRVLRKNELRIVTRPGPLTYQPGQYGIRGLEYELASRFAKYLGVQPSFHPVHHEEIFSLLELKKVDIAAANLAISDRRMQRFLFGPEYLSKSGVLVGHRLRKLPERPGDLSGLTILVNRGSRFTEGLEALAEEHPSIKWQVLERSDTETVLSRVVEDGSLLALIDSGEFARLQFLYPDLKVAFEFTRSQPVAWAFRKNSDLSLYLKAVEFFQHMKLNGDLQRIQSRYASQIVEPDYLDSVRFFRRLRERLPDYEHLFKQASRKTGIDWRLLAAISYQESHWDRDAKSFTGVRGLMMLTHRTASLFEIEDRTDPEQSIMGGALYLRKLMRDLPQRIRHPDRLWLALAAYNIGPGHLEDARVITEKQGGDPDTWADV